MLVLLMESVPLLPGLKPQRHTNPLRLRPGISPAPLANRSAQQHHYSMDKDRSWLRDSSIPGRRPLRPSVSVLPPMRLVQPPVTTSHVYAETTPGITKGTVKSENQDCYFEQMHGSCRALAICDGHGSNGAAVSAFICQKLPVLLFRKAAKRELSSMKAALKSSMEEANQLLSELSGDIKASGTTCVAVMIIDNLLICGNIGDSRAVVGRLIDGIWAVYQLSWDHKPERELERIVAAGGEVTGSKSGRGGPMRVYVKGELYPGLAMSRCMGHTIAEKAGVISDPEFQAIQLTPNDKFLIIGSDGLWRVFSSMEAVRFASALYPSNSAEICKALVTEAQRRWLQRGSTVDDITVIIATFASK